MPDPTETPTPPLLDYRTHRAEPLPTRRAKIGAGIVLGINLLGTVIAAAILTQVPGSRGWDRFGYSIIATLVGIAQVVVTIAPTVVCLRSASLTRRFKRALWITMAAGLTVSLISILVCDL
jgi:hypothetical protein